MTKLSYQETFEQLQSELETLKKEHPEQYAELLKILDDGMANLASDLEKAIKS